MEPAVNPSASLWSHLTLGPIDSVFGMSEACRNDPRPTKVNLSIGVYSNDDGSPYVMPVIREVEKDLAGRNLDKEYAGILGLKSFRRATLEMSLGKDNPVITNELCATAQTVAGTAALRVIATFLYKHYPFDKTVYVSDFTWPNHITIFRESGFKVLTYRYYDSKTGGLDAAGLYEDLKSIPTHSVVLFQACGHNPTGVDPKDKEWAEISKICKEHGHFVVFDNVYQGYATGDIDEDMSGLRHLVADGHKLAICHTLSKNTGLYGERVGTATIICSSTGERDIVESQMKLVIRPMYSNPPIHGARIAIELLTNPKYREQWLKELKSVYEDIENKKQLFYNALIKTGSQRDWLHILRQRGWFCFTGITSEQAQQLETEYAVYMSRTGRVPVVALQTKDIEYLAKAIYQVTK